MKTTESAASANQITAAAQHLENLCGNPQVFFEGITSIEIGAECLALQETDTPDRLVKKTSAALVKHRYAATEIIITSMLNAVLRTESQGEALDVGIAIAKAHDRQLAAA